jgi:hypothetical protein
MFEKSNVKSGDNVSFKESSESCTHSHEVVLVEIVAAFSTWGGGCLDVRKIISSRLFSATTVRWIWQTGCLKSSP